MYVYICFSIYVYILLCIWICKYVCVCVCMYNICGCVSWVWLCVLYVGTCVSICVCVCVCVIYVSQPFQTWKGNSCRCSSLQRLKQRWATHTHTPGFYSHRPFLHLACVWYKYPSIVQPPTSSSSPSPSSVICCCSTLASLDALSKLKPHSPFFSLRLLSLRADPGSGRTQHGGQVCGVRNSLSSTSRCHISDQIHTGDLKPYDTHGFDGVKKPLPEGWIQAQNVMDSF